MATDQTAAGLASRFQEEQDYILRYVELLRSRLVVSYHDVWSVRGVLESWKLASRDKSLEEERKASEKSPAQIRQEVEYLAQIAPSVNRAIEEQKVLLEGLFPNGETPKLTALQSEWVEYLKEHYADALLTIDHDDVLRQCKHQHDWQCADADEPLEMDSLRPAITYATGLRSARKINALESAMEGLKELELLMRVTTPDAEVNILRQGFILLMTAFDAAIFDLVRFALKKRFFELIGAFAGPDNKLTLKQIGNYGGLEAVTAGEKT